MSKSNECFDWQTQLDKGKLGEELVRAYYKASPNPKLCDDWDASLDTGCQIEIKTDFFGPKPRNFFFERYSNLSKRSSGPFDGGPFKARHNATYFVVYMVALDAIYWFPCALLADKLESLVEPDIREAPNKHYKSEGFVVSVAGIQYLARKDVLPEKLSPEQQKIREQLRALVRK